MSEELIVSNHAEHAKTKAMWAGAVVPILMTDLYGLTPELMIVPIVAAHTPALLKSFDEIMVNASDHIVGTKSYINITFDGTRFTVINGGKGIPVKLHAPETAVAGKPVYVPEVAFSRFLSGTSIDKDVKSIKGGINGVGAKLANVHSDLFEIETADGKHLYKQTFKARLSVTLPPTITPSTLNYTSVSLIPAYAALQTAPSVDHDIWIRLRAHQVAAYLGPDIKVQYNGVECLTTSAALLCDQLLTQYEDRATGALKFAAKAKSPTNPHIWNLSFIVLPAGKKATKKTISQNTTIINGVLTNKGSHLTHIKSMFRGKIEELLAKHKSAATPTEVMSGLHIVMCGAIPTADWSGQRKDELQVKPEVIDQYVLPAAFIKQLAEAIVGRVLVAQVSKAAKVVHEKYTPAIYAGHKTNKIHTYLLAAEGDSAITLLRAGLTLTKKGIPKGGPSLDWCGIISLQGVILNAAREVAEVETTEGAIYVRSEKLRTNKRLCAIADAFGLKYDCPYDTPEQCATLNYGQLLLCVDQDLDGTGKIAPLVLVWLHLFWPKLIANGKVGRFITPIVRAFRSGADPIDFQYENEFNEWLTHNDIADYQIKYYKGLAAHDEYDVTRMFTPDAFKASIYTYTIDDAAASLFHIYFGEDSDLRKVELSTPVQYLTLPETHVLKVSRTIPVGRVQLNIETKAFKNEAIRRQLPHIIDGQNPTRRKIIMGSIIRMGSEAKSKDLKVFQLGGAIADKMFYHHGDASLNGTIVLMAQKFIGARKYPYLTGVGQFGSRHGEKAGSPRYVGVKLSPFVRAVFPSEDRWLLPYSMEDGVRAEPKYFVPVVPMVVLENYKIVSEGWNHVSFARDVRAVLQIVKAYIAGDPELLQVSDLLCVLGIVPIVAHKIAKLACKWPLPVSTQDYKGPIKVCGGKIHSLGLYTWVAPLLTITELPIGVITAPYIIKIKAKLEKYLPYDIHNCSETNSVCLQIKLKPGMFEEISQKYGTAHFDPIEDAFSLHVSLHSNLNYYGTEDNVIMLGHDNYLTAILYWTTLRRDLYSTRLDRDQLLLTLKIKEEENIITYIESGHMISKIANDSEAIAALRKMGLCGINHVLHRPEYLTVEELSAAVLDNESFDYILNLKERDLLQSALLIRKAKKEKLVAELAVVNAQINESPFSGASIWLKDVEAFEALI